MDFDKRTVFVMIKTLKNSKTKHPLAFKIEEEKILQRKYPPEHLKIYRTKTY